MVYDSANTFILAKNAVLIPSTIQVGLVCPNNRGASEERMFLLIFSYWFQTTFAIHSWLFKTSLFINAAAVVLIEQIVLFVFIKFPYCMFILQLV